MVTHLPRFGSTHATVMIQLEINMNAQNRRKVRVFRFEESWTKDEKCEEAISRCWNSGMGSCPRKIEAIKQLDSVFEEYRVSSTRKEIIRVEKFLQNRDVWKDSQEEIARYKELDRYHVELHRREETN